MCTRDHTHGGVDSDRGMRTLTRRTVLSWMIGLPVGLMGSVAVAKPRKQRGLYVDAYVDIY